MVKGVRIPTKKPTRYPQSPGKSGKHVLIQHGSGSMRGGTATKSYDRKGPMNKPSRKSSASPAEDAC